MGEQQLEQQRERQLQEDGFVAPTTFLASMGIEELLAAQSVLPEGVDEDFDENRCLHGSTIEAYQNPEYLAFLKMYDFFVNHAMSGGEQLERFFHQFENRYERFLQDEEFCKWLFAYCVDGFRHHATQGDVGNIPKKHLDTLKRHLMLAIESRYGCPVGMELKSEHEKSQEMEDMAFEKYHKYAIEVRTNRGFVSCLQRETKAHCNCMKAGKKVVKKMPRTWVCAGCKKEVCTEIHFLCSLCGMAKYCTRECQKKNWQEVHKYQCDRRLEKHKARCDLLRCSSTTAA